MSETEFKKVVRQQTIMIVGTILMGAATTIITTTINVARLDERVKGVEKRQDKLEFVEKNDVDRLDKSIAKNENRIDIHLSKN